MPPHFHLGGGAYSITAVRPYVLSVLSIRMKNGFPLLSFEKISVFYSYFSQAYKYRSSSILGKIH